MTPQEWTAEMLGLLWTLGQAVVEVQMLCVHGTGPPAAVKAVQYAPHWVPSTCMGTHVSSGDHP